MTALAKRPVVSLAALCAVLTACQGDPPQSAVDSAPAVTIPGRWYTQAQVDQGRPIYAQFCASCHGADGSATADWRTTDANGNYPPPPLNGTAHTWHHPMLVLTDTIANGGAEYGGLMPAFGEVIDEQERIAIVAYIQSWWTDDIYARWYEIESR